MAGKLTFLIGFGAGYVLGAKAGRGRYEQIRTKAEEVWHDPRVQSAAQQAEATFNDVAQQAGETITEKAGQAAEAAKHIASDAATAAKEKVTEVRSSDDKP